MIQNLFVSILPSTSKSLERLDMLWWNPSQTTSHIRIHGTNKHAIILIKYSLWNDSTIVFDMCYLRTQFSEKNLIFIMYMLYKCIIMCIIYVYNHYSCVCCFQVLEEELKPGGGDIPVTESNKGEYIE